MLISWKAHANNDNLMFVGFENGLEDWQLDTILCGSLYKFL